MARTSFKNMSGREGPVSGTNSIVSAYIGAYTTTSTVITKIWKAPAACRISSISAAGTYSAGSATYTVANTTGTVLAATAFGATTTSAVTEGAANLANRDLAKGDTLTITITPTGLTSTGMSVDVTVYFTGQINANVSDD